MGGTDGTWMGERGPLFIENPALRAAPEGLPGTVNTVHEAFLLVRGGGCAGSTCMYTLACIAVLH